MSNIWYDKTPLLSHNYLHNYIIGMRGGGKTYAFTSWAISDFLKTGKQFVWVRRYGTELKSQAKSGSVGCIDTFFDDQRDLFDGVKLKTKGLKAYINNELAGHFVALSTAHTLKGSKFPKVNKIIFDEFLIDKSVYHYLPNEMTAYNDLYETIDRGRDETRMINIGNALSFSNPHFMYHKVRPFKGKFYKDKERNIIVQMYFNEEFAKYRQSTRQGKALAGTEYEQYALYNNFLLDSDTFIEPRAKDSKYHFTLVYQGRSYGAWISYNAGLMYMSSKCDTSCTRRYSVSKTDHNVNMLLVKNVKGTRLETLVYCFNNGLLRFEDMHTKNMMFEALSLFVR